MDFVIREQRNRLLVVFKNTIYFRVKNTVQTVMCKISLVSNEMARPGSGESSAAVPSNETLARTANATAFDCNINDKYMFKYTERGKYYRYKVNRGDGV